LKAAIFDDGEEIPAEFAFCAAGEGEGEDTAFAEGLGKEAGDAGTYPGGVADDPEVFWAWMILAQA